MIKRLKYYLLQLYGIFVFRKRVGVLGYFVVENKKNVVIGDDCGINSGVYISAHSKVVIGNNVVLSVGVKIIDTGLELKDFSKIKKPKHITSFVIIEDDVWIGAGAIVLPGVRNRKEKCHWCG